MLNEIKTVDEGAGMISFFKFLELLRRMDDQWEYQERKVEIAIIDETKYSENDLDNLRQLYQTFSVIDKAVIKRFFYRRNVSGYVACDWIGF